MQGIKWETVLTCSPHGYNNERRGEGRRIRRNEGKLVARTTRTWRILFVCIIRVFQRNLSKEGRKLTGCNGLSLFGCGRGNTIRAGVRQAHAAWRGLAWAGHLRATIKASWEQISAPLVELILKRAAGIGGAGLIAAVITPNRPSPLFHYWNYHTN